MLHVLMLLQVVPGLGELPVPFLQYLVDHVGVREEEYGGPEYRQVDALRRGFGHEINHCARRSYDREQA